MTKIKTTEIPGRAKKLFIKLYCEHRGGKTDENLHNGAQSWLSLSLTKKKHFYDTISTKSAVKQAQLIIQLEPYLREKFPHKNQKHNDESDISKEYLNTEESNSDHTSNLVPSLHDDTITECDNSYIEDHHLSEKQPESSQSEAVRSTEECVLEPLHNELQLSEVQKQQHSYLNRTDEETDTADEFEEERNVEFYKNGKRRKHPKVKPVSKTINKGLPTYVSVIDEETDTADEFADERMTEKVPLVEPTLPIAKTGKELYELLKDRRGVTKAYESLTWQEKIYYGRAVLIIKKDYVKKYKEYLESLSSRQLFDKYRKVFET